MGSSDDTRGKCICSLMQNDNVISNAMLYTSNINSGGVTQWPAAVCINIYYSY